VGSAEVEHYVVNAAKARGIDPGTALAVYFSEGSAGFKSSIPGENSWGPFQLYTGDGKGRTGLGNTFVDSGHGDPSDPNNWKKTVDFALNKAVEGGWGPWNGAKVVGVTGRQGIANDARVIPVGAQVHQDDPDDYVEESTKPTEMKDRSVISYANQVNRGDLNAKPKAGSRVIEAQNGIRNKPIDPALKNAFETAATATGVQIRVTSGGQTPDRDPAKKDQPGGWTGSLRHNHGRAADVDILDESGRVITDRNDPRRLAFLEAVAKAGAGGIGTGYMGDPLKVHIGITGASGEVGKGLGVYSRQSTPQEVAAIERGLKAGGVLDHISPGYSGGAYAGGDGGGHRVRYASLNTGTMTDASPAPQSYRPQYAQATGADGATVVTSTGAKTWGPVTAETPPAEIEARLKEARDKQNAAGWNHAAISAYEHEFKGNWEKAKQQKAFVLKEADTEISKAVQGFPEKGVPRAKSFKDITDDPKLAAKVEILQQNNPERVEHFRREVLRLNSTGKGRSATPEDREAFIGYMGMSRSNPEEFVKLKLSEIDIDDRHRDQLITRQIQLNEGKDANLEKRIMDNALGIPSVRAQLRVAQILPPSDREDKENPNDPYYKFSGALEAEISAYRADPKNKGALPDSKWITDKTNELLRITGTEKSGGFFGLGAKATPTFEFQVPKKFEAEMTADFKKSGEVPTPRAQREWMIKKRRSGEFNYW